MADFVVYGIPGSPYVRAVLLTLEEKGALWTLTRLKPGETRGPEHLARQPFGRIPAFRHGAFELYETQAILCYLDRVAPGPTLTPADPREEARMNQIIGVIDWCLMPRVTATIGFNRVVAPAFGLPVDEMKIAEAMPGARHCLAELARLQDGQPWMAGEALSLADLHLAGHLLMLSEAPEGEALLAGQPGLAAWLDRLSARASMCRTTWAALAEA